MLYLINSPVLTQFGLYMYQSVRVDEIKSMLTRNSYISAIGHKPTADILTALLSINIIHNRIEIKQSVGDKLIVFKLKGRMEEGKVYTKEEIEKIEYEFGILERTA